MDLEVNFESEYKALLEKRNQIQKEIEDIQSEIDNMKLDPDKLSSMIERFKEIESGSISLDSETNIDPVLVNPETGKPRGGERKRQLRQAVGEFGKNETFGIKDVTELIVKADPNVDEDSLRSYVSATLGDLEEVIKVGYGEYAKKESNVAQSQINKMSRGEMFEEALSQVGKNFEAKDVFEKMKNFDEDIGDSQRSYIYRLLRESDSVEKVARGEYRKADATEESEESEETSEEESSDESDDS